MNASSFQLYPWLELFSIILPACKGIIDEKTYTNKFCKKVGPGRFDYTGRAIYGTIRDHIQEFYKGEMKKSLNLLINLADHIQE